MIPIKRGTAQKLGLRKPPFGAYRQRYALGISMADIELAARDNPGLRALQEWARLRVDWPEPPKPKPEVLNVEGFRPL